MRAAPSGALRLLHPQLSTKYHTEIVLEYYILLSSLSSQSDTASSLSEVTKSDSYDASANDGPESLPSVSPDCSESEEVAL